MHRYYTYLLWLQITYYAAHSTENLVNEGARLVGLYCNKIATTLNCNLNKRIAGHVLHSVVCFVHKFKQLVHHRL